MEGTPSRIQVLLRLTGDHVSPSSVDASVVGRVLVLFERLILALARGGDEDEDEDEEALNPGTLPRGPARVALLDIVDASDGLVIELDGALGDGPCREINSASNHPELIDEWPPSARRHFIELTKLVTVRGGMGLVLQGHESYALPTTTLVVPPRYLDAAPVLEGPTTVVGVLTNLGLKTKLKVPGRSRPLSVDLTAEQVRNIATAVLERVVVEGRGTWDPATLELKTLRVTSIQRVEIPDIRSAFARLRDVAAGLWDDVDPDAYVEGIREGES